MHVLAVWNQKGGSGKTTSAVNLAAALAEQGLRVLFLDLDPQGSGSGWIGARASDRVLLDCLLEPEELPGLATLVRPAEIAGVELIASSPELIKAERELLGELGADTRLRIALSTLPHRWDYLLIDCPPAVGLLTANALSAATWLLVPIEASTLALTGAVDLVKTFQRVKRRSNPQLELAGFFVCRFNRTNVSDAVARTLHEHFPHLTLDTVIHESVRLREAPGHRQSILDYAPQSSGATDYRALATELRSRLEESLPLAQQA